MAMVKVKVGEAADAVLDWLVAKCNGEEVVARADGLWIEGGPLDDYDTYYSPSTIWGQCGPLIENAKISIDCVDSEHWAAVSRKRGWIYGPTPLIAAMRCYVASKMGAEVEVPAELVK